MLANDIIGFHTHAYCINFLRCCDELLEDADVDYVNGEVRHDGRKTLARAYPLSIDAERLERAAESPEVAEAEREVLERRRKHLIIRVDRADLSKNVLRGFTAFDAFLTQHPEFREEVTFIAHLQPSRQDVPEYAEYLERIEALVAVVNHRHGTTDWMPIDLKIYENFHDAVARYKHFDLLMVNSLFDGMNLVAKEAPAVNTRDGVLMLSENTGSHEELWRLRDLGQPLRHPGAGRRDLPGADDAGRRSAGSWSQGLKEIIYSRNPGDWVDDQLRDIEELREARRVGGELARAPGLGRGMGGVRIRWGGGQGGARRRRRAARRCELLPALLQPPEPPPLAADVGLPRVEVEPEPVAAQSPHDRGTKSAKPPASRRRAARASRAEARQPARRAASAPTPRPDAATARREPPRHRRPTRCPQPPPPPAPSPRRRLRVAAAGRPPPATPVHPTRATARRSSPRTDRRAPARIPPL